MPAGEQWSAPVMSTVHHMWSYFGSKDVTRINVADLSDKELLDEVRCLTYFSQEDSIRLVALQDLYELTHLPAEVILMFHTRYDTCIW
jgi:hypothetical protein